MQGKHWITLISSNDLYKASPKQTEVIAKRTRIPKIKKAYKQLCTRLQALYARNRNRTDDLHLTMVLLYRLSYSGVFVFYKWLELLRSLFFVERAA